MGCAATFAATLAEKAASAATSRREAASEKSPARPSTTVFAHGSAAIRVQFGCGWNQGTPGTGTRVSPSMTLHWIEERIGAELLPVAMRIDGGAVRLPHDAGDAGVAATAQQSVAEPGETAGEHGGDAGPAIARAVDARAAPQPRLVAVRLHRPVSAQ